METLWQQVISDITATDVNAVSSAFKLCLSMVLGSVVGLERKRKGQSAGMRTFALIAMGATLAMILSIYVPQEYLGLKNGDPGRIAAQVISGIGFLGAGAIIQMKGSVRGLTTAAGIWMVATIGMAVGLGMYGLSVFATVLIYFILYQLERIEHRIKVGTESRIIRMRVSGIISDIAPYRRVLRDHKVHLSDVYVAYDYTAPSTSINFVVLTKEKSDYTDLFESLSHINPTQSISIATQISQ